LELTAAEILDKRSSRSGVEYRCELKLWLAADLVGKIPTGLVRVRSYEN
jgi:hypothetical protein